MSLEFYLDFGKLLRWNRFRQWGLRFQPDVRRRRCREGEQPSDGDEVLGREVWMTIKTNRCQRLSTFSTWVVFNLGGLDLSRRGLDRDSRSWHQKKVSLDGRENLDSFKKLVSTIEKSRFCLDTTIQIQISRSRLRFIETNQDLPKISIISRSRLRSSYNFHKSRLRLLLLIHFTNRHLWKDVAFHSCLKISQKCREISRNLEKSRQSRFVSIVSMYLDDLDKYLDKDKSRLKNLDFKNLNQEKKLVDLDMMDILDGFQKLVSPRRTFSISISIGLDCRDPQP